MDSVQTQVLSPLNSLLNLFQGPQRLIQKRNDKCLDYDHRSNKIDKIKDREKLKAVSCKIRWKQVGKNGRLAGGFGRGIPAPFEKGIILWEQLWLRIFGSEWLSFMFQ